MSILQRSFWPMLAGQLFVLMSACASSSMARQAPMSPADFYESAPSPEFTPGQQDLSLGSNESLVANSGQTGDTTSVADRSAEADAEQITTIPPKTINRRLMIYQASYQILVANVDDSIVRFTTKIEKVGGYLEQRADKSLTVRIPAQSFFDILQQLPDFGRVLTQNLNSVDVTKRVADLKLRIANALATRERLTQLLQRATVIEDILKIEAELRRLTEEIETMQAELKGLVDQIAYSTLTVSFVPNAPEASAFMQRRYSRFGWINAIGFEGFDNGF